MFHLRFTPHCTEQSWMKIREATTNGKASNTAKSSRGGSMHGLRIMGRSPRGAISKAIQTLVGHYDCGIKSHRSLSCSKQIQALSESAGHLERENSTAAKGIESATQAQISRGTYTVRDTFETSKTYRDTLKYPISRPKRRRNTYDIEEALHAISEYVSGTDAAKGWARAGTIRPLGG